LSEVDDGDRLILQCKEMKLTAIRNRLGLQEQTHTHTHTHNHE